VKRVGVERAKCGAVTRGYLEAQRSVDVTHGYLNANRSALRVSSNSPRKRGILSGVCNWRRLVLANEAAWCEQPGLRANSEHPHKTKLL
jgi:hypothetical protein